MLSFFGFYFCALRFLKRMIPPASKSALIAAMPPPKIRLLPQPPLPEELSLGPLEVPLPESSEAPPPEGAVIVYVSTVSPSLERTS